VSNATIPNILISAALTYVR